MSVIENPTSTQDLGSFNGIRYVRYRGRFSGSTVSGAFAVPYELVAPATPAQGSGTVVFEPPHFTSGPIARDVYLGQGFLLDRGFLHGSVGYGNLWFRSLDPRAAFPLVIAGRQVPIVFPGQPGDVRDDNILRHFAYTLRNSPPAFLGAVARVYATGFSDSGDTVHRVYAQFGHKLFDLTFAGTADYVAPSAGAGRLMVFNTEGDVDLRTVHDPAFPNRVCYAVPGAPHIPDTSATRAAFPDPPAPNTPFPAVAGTTPLSWAPFARALFLAGDEWVRARRPPPPSATLQVNPGNVVARDVLCNARGGIRHPALVMHEARFIASVVRGRGWKEFGAYTPPAAPTDFDQYAHGFRAATEGLVGGRYLLRPDADALIQRATLHPGSSYTLNYMLGRFVPTRAEDGDGVLPLASALVAAEV
ncbi:MAG TPA: alpha/beta hydrolase domain-containing protein [Longimicrobium sp.]|nr:alpha/beta hydrolase domain-containing protein [Longimicrobium sp.]